LLFAELNFIEEIALYMPEKFAAQRTLSPNVTQKDVGITFFVDAEGNDSSSGSSAPWCEGLLVSIEEDVDTVDIEDSQVLIAACMNPGRESTKDKFKFCDEPEMCRDDVDLSGNRFAISFRFRAFK
jgi:hypothetical protein